MSTLLNNPKHNFTKKQKNYFSYTHLKRVFVVLLSLSMLFGCLVFELPTFFFPASGCTHFGDGVVQCRHHWSGAESGSTLQKRTLWSQDWPPLFSALFETLLHI